MPNFSRDTDIGYSTAMTVAELLAALTVTLNTISASNEVSAGATKDALDNAVAELERIRLGIEITIGQDLVKGG